MKEICNIPKKERYNKDGTATEHFKSILKQLYLTGTVLMVENIDLTYECDQKKYLDLPCKLCVQKSIILELHGCMIHYAISSQFLKRILNCLKQKN